MADVKTLGSTNDVISELAKFTRGLGYPLVPIDGGSESGQIGVATETVLDAPSTVTQNPSGLDTPLQLTFGPPVVTPDVEMDASGNLTFNVVDDWDITLRLSYGRVTSPGVAFIFTRALVNGVQAGSTICTELDDGGFTIPLEYQVNFRSSVGDVVTAEIVRDSLGVDNGGVIATPSSTGWGTSPSCRIIVRRSIVNTEPNPSAIALSL
jgi:hypothetical protein